MLLTDLHLQIRTISKILSLCYYYCSAVILGHENASIHIDAVVDPLCPLGQKLASLLRVLWKYAQPSMRIVLNPMVSYLCFIFPTPF